MIHIIIFSNDKSIKKINFRINVDKRKLLKFFENGGTVKGVTYDVIQDIFYKITLDEVESNYSFLSKFLELLYRTEFVSSSGSMIISPSNFVLTIPMHQKSKLFIHALCQKILGFSVSTRGNAFHITNSSPEMLFGFIGAFIEEITHKELELSVDKPIVDRPFLERRND